ncbi:MAG: diaminopimelate epimerase, partial [Dehalococcoidia bacterium]
MRFAKMQGAGNDFVLVEAQGEEREWPELARAVCDRHFGVGADGLILALPSALADVRMRMFNPDGSEAEMCGNGVRCLAKYAVERGLARPREGRIAIETVPGVLTAELSGEEGRIERVRVSMGRPRFAPADIPMAVEVEPPIKDFPLEIMGQRLRLTCLSLGNPHAVYFYAQPIERFPLEVMGPEVENHRIFPRRANFEVVRLVGRDALDVRVWERGAGATLACGS